MYKKHFPFKKFALKRLKTVYSPHKNYQCACKVFGTFAIPYRFLGRFPYSWGHVNGLCTYKISIPWVVYSVVLLASLTLAALYFFERMYFNIHKLPVFLDDMINALGIANIHVIFLHLINGKLWIDIVAKLNHVNKDHLFCQQSRNMTRNFQRNVQLVNFLFICAQNAVAVLLKVFLAPEFSLNVLFFRNLFVLPVWNFLFICCWAQYCMSMFICFENVTMRYLNIYYQRPAKDIKYTHNEYSFMGISWGNSICDEKHYLPEHLRGLPKAQVIDYLRIKHEEMYEIFLLMQDSSSPQLLIYLIIELAGSVIMWYSIVAALVYGCENPMVNCIFMLNCIYSIWHGVGIFWFFKIMHELKKIVQGLKPILMEAILSAQTVEEHQQLRIFANKISNQGQFSVNDFFEIDLGIVGPIVGNVLTYVLVALQFEIPPLEQH